jgi:nucleolar protein 53
MKLDFGGVALSDCFLFYLEGKREILRQLKKKKKSLHCPLTMPVKQKNAQPSRKGKKAWRKNIDINDVEEHLEQMRSEERAG